MFIGLLREAPGGLTFQAPVLLGTGAYPPLLAQTLRARTFDRLPATPSMGPGDVRLARQDLRGLDRRQGITASHLQRPLGLHPVPKTPS